METGISENSHLGLRQVGGGPALTTLSLPPFLRQFPLAWALEGEITLTGDD